jgi:hypothetical protein
MRPKKQEEKKRERLTTVLSELTTEHSGLEEGRKRLTTELSELTAEHTRFTRQPAPRPQAEPPPPSPTTPILYEQWGFLWSSNGRSWFEAGFPNSK